MNPVAVVSKPKYGFVSGGFGYHEESAGINTVASNLMKRSEINWRIGGPQGSGIDRIVVLFARACALNGLEVYARREYHSNIMGRHSYVDLRISSDPVTSHAETVDLLVAFEAEAMCRHAWSLSRSGCLIHGADDADISLERITFLDQRVKEVIQALLREQGLQASTAGVLESLRHSGVETFAIPYKRLIKILTRDLGVSRREAELTRNTLAVAASCALWDARKISWSAPWSRPSRIVPMHWQ